MTDSSTYLGSSQKLAMTMVYTVILESSGSKFNKLGIEKVYICKDSVYMPSNEPHRCPLKLNSETSSTPKTGVSDQYFQNGGVEVC